MEQLEHQVFNLSDKLDDLYKLVEQLDTKLSQVVADCNLAKESQGTDISEKVIEIEHYELKDSIAFNPELEHKDVLVDDIFLDGNLEGGDKQLTPDIQIQRLTAQLTAAYNRIAALEEQLLLKRINS